MVTHRYPLTGYQEALRAAARRSESGAMKVLLTPQA
jgi:threonine dehydrogenase-like Zn-dependent dehydrogenase